MCQEHLVSLECRNEANQWLIWSWGSIHDWTYNWHMLINLQKGLTPLLVILCKICIFIAFLTVNNFISKKCFCMWVIHMKCHAISGYWHTDTVNCLDCRVKQSSTSVSFGMDDRIGITISGDSRPDETLNRGSLALLFRRQYEFPSGIIQYRAIFF